jgi:hypothetical protein
MWYGLIKANPETDPRDAYVAAMWLTFIRAPGRQTAPGGPVDLGEIVKSERRTGRKQLPTMSRRRMRDDSETVVYFWCVFRYRRLGWFVWNPRTGYAFRCADQEAVRTLLIEAPHLEPLVFGPSSLRLFPTDKRFTCTRTVQRAESGRNAPSVPVRLNLF